jgi:hypothetical protein
LLETDDADMTAMTLVGGSLADRFGYKRVLLVGAVCLLVLSYPLTLGMSGVLGDTLILVAFLTFSVLLGLYTSAAFAAVTFGQTMEAKAGPTIDLGLNLGTAIQTAGAAATRVDFSLGGNAAVGYRWNIPRSYVYLQPEITGGYMRFGFNSPSVGWDYAGALNGGVRAGLQGVVQPNIFGHVGFGFLGYSSGVADVGYIGPQLDIGAGLDIRPTPGFTIGAQIAYNSVLVPSGPSYLDSAKWVSFGLKAGFQFGEPRPRPRYVRRRYYY